VQSQAPKLGKINSVGVSENTLISAGSALIEEREKRKSGKDAKPPTVPNDQKELLT